jgi:hypothetical protein
LKDYEQLMVQYYGAGVQACYRGPRLYDTDTTRLLVSNTIKWYKRYRDILNAPIVHLRRADGRDWDGWLHVSSTLRDKSLMLLFNPTPEPIRRTIRVPLYYTGLKGNVHVRYQDKQDLLLKTQDDGSITLTVNLPAEGYAWYVIRRPE